MKPFILFLKIAVVVLTTNATAQSLVKCNDQIAYWVINDASHHYAVRLQGDIGLSKQPDILNVNEKALQYVLLDKNPYILKKGMNDDENVLLRYIDGEKNPLLNKFNVKSLEAGREIIILSSGKTAVLWYFMLPEGKNKEVKAQLFADMVIGDRIFGLGVPLFVGENFEAARVFLLNALDGTETVKNPEALCFQ
jgi:hypothetical protein